MKPWQSLVFSASLAILGAIFGRYIIPKQKVYLTPPRQVCVAFIDKWDAESMPQCFAPPEEATGYEIYATESQKK